MNAKLSIPLLLVVSAVVAPDRVEAGAACAVAKRLGNSLAMEWVADARESAASAQQKAIQRLLAKGYRKRGQDVFAQAASDLSHAHVVIIETTYTTRIGRQRTSYGCGFDAHSARDAEWAALRDLQAHSWGWVPDMGYKVIENSRY